MQLRLRKIGNSVGTTLPKEILERFNLREGDALTVVVMEDGIKLTAFDPEFEEVMAAYQEGAAQYRNAMRELADG